MVVTIPPELRPAFLAIAALRARARQYFALRPWWCKPFLRLVPAPRRSSEGAANE